MKIQTKYRQKTLEAILFFSSKKGVKNPSKMMMFKLLAELDFRHFQETGLFVTGLKYQAYPKGPVPKSLQDEITTDKKDLVLPEDFKGTLTIQDTEFEDEKGRRHRGFKYIPTRKPNLKVFSPREQRIMVRVADIYRFSSATEASDASHEPGKPWTKTIQMHNVGATINPFEVLDLTKPLTKEIAEERIREREALIYNYGA